MLGISRVRGGEWGDQQEHSGCAGRSSAVPRGCISRGASAPARAQCTVLKALGGWEREGTLSARLGFFPWTAARGSPGHTFWLPICAEALTTTPLPCPCTAAQRVALQMFTRHWILGLGVFLTPWACRMTQTYSPQAACSHRSRGMESLLYEILGPVGCVGCCALRLLHRVSSRSDCCPLVQPGSCSRVKIEGFLFQNSNRAGGLSPMHLPKHSWHTFSLPV